MNLKLILRIARTELAVLFYSPVAWLLLIAFTCQVGFDFMNILTEIVKIKALGNTITFSIHTGRYFFTVLLKLLSVTGRSRNTQSPNYIRK